MASKKSISADDFRQFDGLSFVPRVPARAGVGGEHPSRKRSPSTDFIEHRPYQTGDDFRRIDWNVYGRLGSLQVKLTEGRERLEVLLALDCSSSMAYGHPEKLEFATSLVAALAHVATARADAVRIACLGVRDRRFGPFHRRGHVPQLLSQLSSIGAVGRVDLNTELLGRVPNGHQLVVIISDLLTSDGVATSLEHLQARRADVAVIHVVSPEEIAPYVTGEVEFTDAESGDVLELGVTLETLAAYRARFEAWVEAQSGECRSRGMRYIRVSSEKPLAGVMLDDLRRGGLLR